MSGMGLGLLEFQLAADLLPLKRDMDQAQSLVGGALGGIKGAFTSMLGGLAAGLGVAAFAAWIQSAIDAGDATKQFSQKTGIAANDVAGLQLAFKQGGVEGDALTASMARLGRQMVDGNRAFTDLGVSTRDTDGSLRSSKDVLYDLADSFNGMEDGARKSALAQEIFGKSGAAMIPTLNEGADGMRSMADMAERLGLVIDQDTAEAADGFNDTVELLGMTTQGMGRQVAAQLLPTLKSLAGTFLDSATSGDKLKKASDILAGGLKLLFTGGAIGVEVFNTLGKVVGGVAGALVSVAQGEFGQAWKILEESGRDITKGWGDTAKTVEAAWMDAGATTVNQAIAMTGATQRTTVATKEQAAAAEKHAAEVAKLTKAGADYLAGLNAQLAGVNNELALGRSLSDAEKAQLKLEEELRQGKLQLTDAQRTSASAALVEIDAKRTQMQLLKDLAKIQSEAIIKALEDSAAVAEQASRQREHNEAIGLTGQGLRALESRRLDDALATAEQALQQALLKDISAEELEGITLMVEELRGLKKAKEEGWAKEAGLEAARAAKQAADEWKRMVDSVYSGLTDSLMRAFENGRGFLDAFKDTLIGAFKNLVLRPMVDDMVKQIRSGVESVMALFGSTANDMAGIKADNSGGAAGGGGYMALAAIFMGAMPTSQISLMGLFEKLGGALTSINAAFESLGLRLIDTSSLGRKAAVNLAELTGGLDAFLTKAAVYLSGYYSEGEQSASRAATVMDTLGAAGINASEFKTRADLRAAMEALDPNVQGDRIKQAALLNSSMDFASISAYLEAQQLTLGGLAAMAPKPFGAISDSKTIDPVEQSNALLTTANDSLASIASATTANTTELQALVAVQSAGTQAIIDRLQSIANGLVDTARGGYLAELAQP